LTTTPTCLSQRRSRCMPDGIDVYSRQTLADRYAEWRACRTSEHRYARLPVLWLDRTYKREHPPSRKSVAETMLAIPPGEAYCRASSTRSSRTTLPSLTLGVTRWSTPDASLSGAGGRRLGSGPAGIHRMHLRGHQLRKKKTLCGFPERKGGSARKYRSWLAKTVAARV